jgi:uncharacterized protein (DUF362 family)
MDNRVCLLFTKPVYPDVTRCDVKKETLSCDFKAIWQDLGFDPDNPFKNFVSRGGTAVIKPNWVMDSNPVSKGLDCLVTHSSIILQVIEWIAEAMGGEGTIVIGDSPIQGCDFGQLLSANRMDEIMGGVRRRYRSLNILVEDWRLTLIDRDNHARFSGKDLQQKYVEQVDKRAKEEYVLIDLGKDSFLEEISDFAGRFRVTCYKPSLMQLHHQHGKHRYLVTNRVFGIDLMVNLPKMKTHAKAGLTGALKNIVGINGHKEYLPHHITGSYQQGGDCYLRSSVLKSLYERFADQFWEHNADYKPFKRMSMAFLLRTLRSLVDIVCKDTNLEASWPGNEVIWRTILDLNHILYFSHNSPKHILTIVDGIVAGEGDGPLRPKPKPTGIIVVGQNPAYIDAVLARIMGYSIPRVPLVYHALYHRKSLFCGPDLKEFSVSLITDNRETRSLKFYDLPVLQLEKPHNWKRAETGTQVKR